MRLAVLPVARQYVLSALFWGRNSVDFCYIPRYATVRETQLPIAVRAGKAGFQDVKAYGGTITTRSRREQRMDYSPVFFPMLQDIF